MRPDAPTPEQILEELADRAATQIDRLAPVAFDVALDELIRQHSFLLAVNAARTPDGKPFNFAEVPGIAWAAPHQEWLRQYSRLFERAAGRIPDDRTFLAQLARVPIRLLPEDSSPKLSRAVLEEIIDLGPMLVHRLEGWVSKRTVVEARADESAVPRHALTGAESRAYGEVVVDIVGAWEHLLKYGLAERADRRNARQTEAEHWDVYREEWPLLWRHLCDTAHMLGAAVWNEDERAARRYCDMLVRWYKTLGRDDYNLYLFDRRLAFPFIFDLNWEEAVARLGSNLPRHSGSVSAEHLDGTLIRSVHDDVVLLVSSLLLDWTMNDKQLSELGARTSAALLRRELIDPDDHDEGAPELRSFSSTFLDVLRLDLAGARYQSGTYGEGLDTLVSKMDTMTERRVVSGRIYTPSTHHERDDLTFALLAILLAALPDVGDDGFVSRIGELAANDSLLPEGDRSLVGLLDVFKRLSNSLEAPWPHLQRGLSILKPDADLASLARRLRGVIEEAHGVIEKHRTERLKAQAIDPGKIERMRAAIEVAIFGSAVPIFQDYQIEGHQMAGVGDMHSVVRSGIAKASLVDPPMTNESVNFVEHLAKAVAASAMRHAWGLFTKRKREQVAVASGAEAEAFWKEIANLTPRISEHPTLVVSRAAEGRAIRGLRDPAEGSASTLRVEYLPRAGRKGEYIATVEGVDVFEGDFPKGVTWLFSGTALRSIRYAALNSAGHHVTLSYEPEHELEGALRAQFEQTAEWSDDPVFEIRSHDSSKGDAQ